MPHIYGQLLNAQLENSAGSPSSGGTPNGRMYLDTTLPAAAVARYFNGTTWVAFGTPSFIPPTRLSFITPGSTTYNLAYAFSIASGSAAAADTYTHNSVTYTVAATVSSGNLIILRGSAAPLASGTLTRASGSGSATLTFYSVQTPLYLRVIALGAGGGGGCSGTADGTAGANGGATSFASLITCNGGVKGSRGGPTGTGGSATISSPAYGIAIAGGGGGGASRNGSSTQQYYGGGVGGASAFGGAGAGGSYQNGGSSAAANSGAGGGGAGNDGSVNATISGAGGGSGGYVDAFIPPTLSATYAVVVGTGGAAQGAGTSGYTGGGGGDGILSVMEFWQ